MSDAAHTPLRAALQASLAATEPHARRFLASEVRAQVMSLDLAARRLELTDPDFARNLRRQAENLRSALASAGA